MRLRKPLLAQVLLLGSFLGGFGFMSYYSVPTKELGEACVLALFFWLALSVRANSKWLAYVFLPAFGLMLFMLTYAYVFASREDVSLLPSLWSQRYYVFFLLGPVVYMLCRRGWEIGDLQRIVVLALFLTLVSRLVADFTIASRPLLLTGEFFTLRLGDIYDDQSFLIRRQDSVLVFLVLYCVGRLFQTRNLLFAFHLAAAALTTAVLLTVLPRALMMATVAALLVYCLFLWRPQQARLTVILLPLYLILLVLAIPQIGGAFAGAFEGDVSYAVRSTSAGIAWDAVSGHPILGLGQDSNQTISYQDLFGENFYPSDVGLLGVALQYGAVGLLLYVYFSAWLFVNLLKLLWAYGGEGGSKERAFLWALFVSCLALILVSPVQSKFLDGYGLPVAAFAWGLLLSLKHGTRRMALPSPQRRPRRAPARRRARRPLLRS